MWRGLAWIISAVVYIFRPNRFRWCAFHCILCASYRRTYHNVRATYSASSWCAKILTAVILKNARSIITWSYNNTDGLQINRCSGRVISLWYISIVVPMTTTHALDLTLGKKNIVKFYPTPRHATAEFIPSLFQLFWNGCGHIVLNILCGSRKHLHLMSGVAAAIAKEA